MRKYSMIGMLVGCMLLAACGKGDAARKEAAEKNTEIEKTEATESTEVKDTVVEHFAITKTSKELEGEDKLLGTGFVRNTSVEQAKRDFRRYRFESAWNAELLYTENPDGTFTGWNGITYKKRVTVKCADGKEVIALTQNDKVTEEDYFKTLCYSTIPVGDVDGNLFFNKLEEQVIQEQDAFVEMVRKVDDISEIQLESDENKGWIDSKGVLRD